MQRVETVIIGGGQAGLAMSRSLSERDVDHVVRERGRLGLDAVGVLDVELPQATDPTPFGRFGQSIPLAMVALGFLSAFLVRRRRPAALQD